MNWISVKERLPEIGNRVLCYYTIGEYECCKICRIYAIKSSDGVIDSVDWIDDDYFDIEPSYWMELPEPPKSE